MRKSRSYSRETGATMVESAIVFPLVLILLLGTLLFAQFLVRKILFSRATNLAARAAAISTTNVTTAARDEFYAYLTPFGIQQNASISVELVNQDGLCAYKITGVSGRWCEFCEAFLGIGVVSSQRLVPLEEPPDPCQ
jgi:Flp pilus assembly protein TadG